MENNTKQNTIDIINRLKQRNETISFAESCTGGQIVSEFTAISGVSSVLHGSVVSYANEIKSQWLNVQEKTLIQYGAVSAQCVDEMLSGIIKLSSSDCAIAVSGIAGPTGGTKEKPVGTVYIGVETKAKKVINRYQFEGDRTSVQKQATETAIELLKKYL
jgi:nicotinamide-nucleotide amidase